MGKNSEVDSGFAQLVELMAQLRGEKGCPWDKEQTHTSLKPALLEETYEVLDAIDRGDPQELKRELGDLLLQVVFHARIAAEQGDFAIGDIVSSLSEKLIHRHPHVFSGTNLPDAEAVLRQRLQIKAREKQGNMPLSSLGELPRAMPALARAQRITERASHFGFDWPDPAPVWQKIDEEMSELKKAYSSRDKEQIGKEMGDLLFSLVNLCRFLDLQAEEVLRETVDRFIRRFGHIESELKQKGKTLEDASLEEMDLLWEEAKKRERGEKSQKNHD